ncbi:hypothetical protein ACHAQA_005919 [Verticillium albo-atrum]
MPGLTIKTGFWRNYNDDTVTGTFLDVILTLPKAQGTLLVSFLTLFMSLSVANLWPIFCLIIHQWRSTSSPRQGLYHQQQAILSNTLSPAASALSFTKLAWAWRKAKIRGTHRSSLMLILAAVFSMILFAIAGLASTRIELQSDEVLVRSDTCGWVGLDFSPVNNEDEAFNSLNRTEQLKTRVVTSAWAQWMASRGLEYVRNCYTVSNVSVRSDSCEAFTVASLPVVTRNISCPFPDDICGLPDAFQVDTGFIDSSSDLGINADEGDRIRFRKLLTCVPMPTEQFATDWVDQSPFENTLLGDKYKYFNVGSTQDGDYTWAVSNYSFFDVQAYKLGAYQYSGDLNTRRTTEELQEYLNTFPPAFIPIPALVVPDADTAVVYMMNNARYSSAVDDPFFRATNQTDATGVNRVVAIPGELWISDNISSALACTEQYQFCAKEECSALAGITRNITDPWLGLELSNSQQAVFNMITSGLSAVTLTNGIFWLGPEILRANEFMWFANSLPFSTGLPPTQWQDEVTNFGQASLAVLQRMVVDYAAPSRFVIQTSTGPVPSDHFIKPPRTEAERELCHSIRVRDARYTNFSAVGLLVTLIIGLVAIMTNVFLMPQASFWVKRKLHRTTYPEREWTNGSLLMQQREALEAKGIGPWELDGVTGIPWVRPSGVHADGRVLSGGSSAYQPVGATEELSKEARMEEKPVDWA